MIQRNQRGGSIKRSLLVTFTPSVRRRSDLHLQSELDLRLRLNKISPVWSANISVWWRLTAGAAGRGWRGVGGVRTWGPAGYDTPVELRDQLTVSLLAADHTHVASRVHEREGCGFWCVTFMFHSRWLDCSYRCVSPRRSGSAKKPELSHLRQAAKL